MGDDHPFDLLGSTLSSEAWMRAPERRLEPLLSERPLSTHPCLWLRHASAASAKSASCRHDRVSALPAINSHHRPRGLLAEILPPARMRAPHPAWMRGTRVRTFDGLITCARGRTAKALYRRAMCEFRQPQDGTNQVVRRGHTPRSSGARNISLPPTALLISPGSCLGFV